MKRFAMVLAVVFAAGPAIAFGDSVTMVIPDVADSSLGGFAMEGTDYAEAPSAPVAGDHYLIVGANIKFDTLPPVTPFEDTFYQEFAVSAAGPYNLTITNDPASIDVLDTGYFLSDTLIPLDNLNYGTNPPPSDSQFTPLPSLDQQLGDGLSETGTIAPLPSAAGMGFVVLGLMGMMGLVRRKARVA